LNVADGENCSGSSGASSKHPCSENRQRPAQAALASRGSTRSLSVAPASEGRCSVQEGGLRYFLAWEVAEEDIGSQASPCRHRGANSCVFAPDLAQPLPRDFGRSGARSGGRKRSLSSSSEPVAARTVPPEPPHCPQAPAAAGLVPWGSAEGSSCRAAARFGMSSRRPRGPRAARTSR